MNMSETVPKEMPKETTDTKSLDLLEMKSLIQDLFAVRTHIYWLDMGVSALIAWVFFVAALTVDASSPLYTLYFLISCLAFYRAILFIHEIAHVKENSLP